MVHNIDLCFLGHESLAAIMMSRLKNLSVVARYWGDGDIKVKYNILILILFHEDELYIKYALTFTSGCEHQWAHIYLISETTEIIVNNLIITLCYLKTAVQVSVDMNDQAVLVDLLNVLCLKQWVT